MAPRPSCAAPTLHGASRLSRASCDGTPPLAVDGAAHAPVFTEEEFHALMSGQCEMLSVSDGDAQFQSKMARGNAAQFQANAPRFSIDNIIQAPLSDADAELLAQMLCNDETEAILLAAHPPPPRSGSRLQAAARKRKRPLRSSGDTDAKRARRKTKRARLLRAAHREVAARILTRRFRAPEPSRGWTLLRCQCAELAAGGRGGCCCALHQDAGAGGEEEWAREARRRVPIAAGPGEVRVPRLSARDSVAKVTQYGRWRRSVWMPTRFYLQHAAERGGGGQMDDGWMTDD